MPKGKNAKKTAKDVLLNKFGKYAVVLRPLHLALTQDEISGEASTEKPIGLIFEVKPSNLTNQQAFDILTLAGYDRIGFFANKKDAEAAAAVAVKEAEEHDSALEAERARASLGGLSDGTSAELALKQSKLESAVSTQAKQINELLAQNKELLAALKSKGGKGKGKAADGDSDGGADDTDGLSGGDE